MNVYTQFCVVIDFDPSLFGVVEDAVSRGKRTIEAEDEDRDVFCDVDLTSEQLVLSSEEGIVEDLEAILTEVYEALEMTEPLIFSWAVTSSRMVDGGFSGGAAVITQFGTTWLDALTLADGIANNTLRIVTREE